MVLPATAAIGLLFIGGLVEGLGESIGYSGTGQPCCTFIAYREMLGSADFWKSLALTLRVSILSTIAAGFLGVWIAVSLFMLRRTKTYQLWQRWFQLPMMVPHLAGAYLMALLLMQSGWLSRIFFHLGWINEIHDFPVLINDRFGWGIVLAYAWKEAPFIALMLYPVLMRIHDSWLEVARVFGAGRFHFIKEILLPLFMPAWISSAFIVFAFTFSAFEVPFLLGVTYPKMLPVLSYDLYTSGGLARRPDALAVNIILVAITAVLGFAAYRISGRFKTGEGNGW
jgi:putative spermidine/putrescine transport system permease protein